jgi:hypothetical protein
MFLPVMKSPVMLIGKRKLDVNRRVMTKNMAYLRTAVGYLTNKTTKV